MKTTLSPGDTGADVGTLQRRLNAKGAHLVVDHIYGPVTAAAVREFQILHGLIADGIAGPRTQGMLLGVAPGHGSLTQSDIAAAAADLGCSEASILAVIAVEAPAGGYLPDGRTVILYERHVMYRLLKDSGRDPAPYVAARPDIVNPVRGGYIGGGGEYGRLAAAKRIDLACALQSCSWGRFQIMGFHYADLGYADVQAFVDAMATSEALQLDAFVQFVRRDPALLEALRQCDWPTFARGYNGPAYADNRYDVRLAEAYARSAALDPSGGSAPAPQVAASAEPPPVAPRRRRRRKTAAADSGSTA